MGLLVGVNSDASIFECKGPPVLNDTERQAAVASCRFVDDIIAGSPYIMTEDYIQLLIRDHQVDIFVHGDDPCIVNGKDVYATAKAMGMFKTVPRTEGVSTTDIVGRALLLTQSHHDRQELWLNPAKPVSAQAKSLVTSNLYTRFLAELPGVDHKKHKKIIYIDGAWDMFHAGHISTLKCARELGDCLVVGIHSDSTVNAHKGANYPIMNLQERTLTLAACRYVDDIVIDAPRIITRELIASLKIAFVACGTHHDQGSAEGSRDDFEPYAIPNSMGILRHVQSTHGLTVDGVLSRIQANRERLPLDTT